MRSKSTRRSGHVARRHLAAALVGAIALLALPAGAFAAGGGGVTPGGPEQEPGGSDPGAKPPTKYVPVPSKGYGFIHPKSSPKRCGYATPATLKRAKAAARIYYDIVKAPLIFWDFGHNCPGHLSHKRGMDSDITTAKLPVLSHRSNVRLAYSRVMAQAMFAAGACFVIYNDRRSQKEWPKGHMFTWPNHWNHFHVRWHSLDRFDGRKCAIKPRNQQQFASEVEFSGKLLRAYHRGKKLPQPPDDNNQGSGGGGGGSGGGGVGG